MLEEPKVDDGEVDPDTAAPEDREALDKVKVGSTVVVKPDGPREGTELRLLMGVEVVELGEDEDA